MEVVLGKIVNTYGLKGALKVYSLVILLQKDIQKMQR